MVEINDVRIEPGKFDDICKKFFYGFELSDIKYLNNVNFVIDFCDTDDEAYFDYDYACYDVSKILEKQQKINSRKGTKTKLEAEKKNSMLTKPFDYSGPAKDQSCKHMSHEKFGDVLIKYFNTMF
eukprot:GAHX01003639.1.p2 GENE.GAHX01003639.1~~GAHX01003639.1.p2  ORF type:complete len:125 (-),score=20.53 GAHX01003639.1:10-384(-)